MCVCVWKVRWLQACEHKVLAVHSGNLAGFWPIPEAFRLEPGLTVLPPRAAQPRLAFLPQVRCHVIAFSHLAPLPYLNGSSAPTFSLHSCAACWHCPD